MVSLRSQNTRFAYSHWTNQKYENWVAYSFSKSAISGSICYKISSRNSNSKSWSPVHSVSRLWSGSRKSKACLGSDGSGELIPAGQLKRDVQAKMPTKRIYNWRYVIPSGWKALEIISQTLLLKKKYFMLGPNEQHTHTYTWVSWTTSSFLLGMYCFLVYGFWRFWKGFSLFQETVAASVWREGNGRFSV